VLHSPATLRGTLRSLSVRGDVWPRIGVRCKLGNRRERPLYALERGLCAPGDRLLDPPREDGLRERCPDRSEPGATGCLFDRNPQKGGPSSAAVSATRVRKQTGARAPGTA
jgi:hypothetical protein